MNIDIIVVKKTIPGVINRGIYDASDVMREFPFLNFSDNSWFEKTTKELIDVGTKVRYRGEKYYVVKNRPHRGINETITKYHIKGFSRISTRALTADDVDIQYGISKSMTDNERDWLVVSGSDLERFKPYWFISSQGEIHQAHLGEFPAADDWRMISGNMFSSKAEADIRKEEIKKGAHK